MPNELKIHWPFKPYEITQHWGNPNAVYSTQFNDPAFKLHNGVDANTGKKNYDGSVATEFPVYCPVENFIVQRVDFSPEGGGNELWLMSNEPLQMFDKKAYAWIPLCHAKKILVKPGDQPKLGELIMIADNTGFSTGLHTHMGLYRVNNTPGMIQKLDTNDAEGSFSPELFFTNTYAVDQADITTLVRSNIRYYQYKLGII